MLTSLLNSAISALLSTSFTFEDWICAWSSGFLLSVALLNAWVNASISTWVSDCFVCASSNFACFASSSWFFFSSCFCSVCICFLKRCSSAFVDLLMSLICLDIFLTSFWFCLSSFWAAVISCWPFLLSLTALSASFSVTSFLSLDFSEVFVSVFSLSFWVSSVVVAEVSAFTCSVLAWFCACSLSCLTSSVDLPSFSTFSVVWVFCSTLFASSLFVCVEVVFCCSLLFNVASLFSSTVLFSVFGAETSWVDWVLFSLFWVFVAFWGVTCSLFFNTCWFASLLSIATGVCCWGWEVWFSVATGVSGFSKVAWSRFSAAWVAKPVNAPSCSTFWASTVVSLWVWAVVCSASLFVESVVSDSFAVSSAWSRLRTLTLRIGSAFVIVPIASLITEFSSSTTTLLWVPAVAEIRPAACSVCP